MVGGVDGVEAAEVGEEGESGGGDGEEASEGVFADDDGSMGVLALKNLGCEDLCERMGDAL